MSEEILPPFNGPVGLVVLDSDVCLKTRNFKKSIK